MVRKATHTRPLVLMATSINERLRLHKEAEGLCVMPKTPIMDSHAWTLSHDKPYLLSPSSQKCSWAVRRNATERFVSWPRNLYARERKWG